MMLVEIIPPADSDVQDDTLSRSILNALQTWACFQIVKRLAQ